MLIMIHGNKGIYIYIYQDHIDDLVQDCSNSIANALELLQSCSKPWLYTDTLFKSAVGASTELLSNYI